MRGGVLALAVALAAGPATAGTTTVTESILPPGMRTLTIELTRDPDVRCVIPNCFTPPTRHRGESQRRFERRLLSPNGPPGRME